MKRLAVYLILFCAACADAPAPAAPSVRIAIAQEQMTATYSAQAQAASAPTETAQAIRAQAEWQSVSATGTAIAVRGTEQSAHATATAQAQATQAHIVAVLTQQAIDESAIRNSQRASLILTQAMGEMHTAEAESHAQSLALYVLYIGGALAVVIVIIGLAARVAGPSLAHAGTALASQIRAHGEAYAAGREADGHYRLRASQGQAALVVARHGVAAGQRKAAIPATPAQPLSPEIASALTALKACRDIVGGAARFLPKADELSGPTREALDPLKGNGLISVQRGRGGGLYLARHMTLDSLITELERGYIALPTAPPHAGAELEKAPKVPIEAL